MSPTFTSLGVRNYRVYAAGMIVSNTGTWMGRVGQDWLVLTELTPNSGTALGIVTGLQFLPFVLLAPWSGVIADRFPKRRILAVTQTGLGVVNLLLGFLVLAGLAQLWHVYVIALLAGMFTAADNPARQAFVSEMVPTSQIANAVSLNSASFNAGRLLGPGIAGLIIAAWGTGTALVINGFSYAAVLTALSLMRAAELRNIPKLTSRKGAISEGLRYVRGRRDLQIILALVFVFGTFGLNFQLTTALIATETFHKGPTEYGILGSILAIGSLSAGLLAARRPHPRLRTFLSALVGFTVAAAFASIAPTYEIFAVSLIPVGLFALTALITANSMIQLRVDPIMRGRVMALYMAIFLGGTPIGAPIIGWLGDVLGARWTLGIGPIAVGLSLAALSYYLVKAENVHVSYESHRRPRFIITTTSQPEVVR